MTTFTDDTFGGYYDLDESYPLQVEIMQNVEDPNIYRLVNPYANHPVAASLVHTGHNHYLDIDVTDPEDVYIDETPLGFDLGDGMITIMSANADDRGTFDGQTVKFPTKSLYMYVGEDFVYGCYNGNFAVEIPTGDAISEITETGTADVRYYDLQGRRVDASARGLLINSRGQKLLRK